MSENTYTKVLSIAGSDSGGCAGIQADLKTFSALGCFGMTAITSITAQNTVGVQRVVAVDPSMIYDQICSVLEDIGVDAIKIGMLGNSNAIEAVFAALSDNEGSPLILDPVMVAASGQALTDPEAIEVMVSSLFPLATLVTPNLAEVSLLVGGSVGTHTEMLEAASSLVPGKCQNILVKGGHLSGDTSDDLLYTFDGSKTSHQWISSTRVETRNTHGTGCTLSSAIAAYLARGYGLYDSVALAKAYIDEAITAGSQFCTGKGSGPVHHFCGQWKTHEAQQI